MNLNRRRLLLNLAPPPPPDRVHNIGCALGLTYRQTLHFLAEQHRRQLRRPIKGEKCGARTRKGVPCKAPAMGNGRCRLHGGLSTGARTLEGRRRSYGTSRKNLPRYVEPAGPSKDDLLEHIACGGELRASHKKSIREFGSHEVWRLIQALQLADIVIADDINLLSLSAFEKLVDPLWFEMWFSRKRRQIDQQRRLRLKLEGAEQLGVPLARVME